MIGPPQIVLILVAFQRLAELVLARRNTRRLLAAGAREYGAAHYPLIVALHAGWLAALALTVPPDAAISWPLLAIYLLLQAGRVWTIATLGPRWTTRIIVPPKSRPVRQGPYRWLRHPNYWIVALEIPLLPMTFGAWTLAATFGVANVAVLSLRIRTENAALAGNAKP